MKKIIFILCGIFLLSACTVGEFKEDRIRLHDMGKKDICQKNPQRCIEGTQIEW